MTRSMLTPTWTVCSDLLYSLHTNQWTIGKLRIFTNFKNPFLNS